MPAARNRAAGMNYSQFLALAQMSISVLDKRTGILYSRPMATVSALDTLNPAQRAAAGYGARAAGEAFRAGPLLIIAGAGTGKTNTLAHRVAHLVREGVNPQRILLLTFTRRAAVEMTRRAQRIVGEVQREVRLPWSGTFHSIAN